LQFGNLKILEVMTIEYIRYKVTAERRKAFIATYDDPPKNLDISEFCIAMN